MHVETFLCTLYSSMHILHTIFPLILHNTAACGAEVLLCTPLLCSESMQTKLLHGLHCRFVNSQAAKWQFRAGQIEQAEKTAAMFTKDGDQANNLHDMQCMWFEIENGRANLRRPDYGKVIHSCNDHYLLDLIQISSKSRSSSAKIWLLIGGTFFHSHLATSSFVRIPFTGHAVLYTGWSHLLIVIGCVWHALRSSPETMAVLHVISQAAQSWRLQVGVLLLAITPSSTPGCG